MRIVWDPAKGATNLRKHDVSFEDAAKLLACQGGFLGIYDDLHSTYEDRFVAIGWARRRLIVVSYAEPDEDELRIISARVDTKAEREFYEDHEKARFPERDS